MWIIQYVTLQYSVIPFRRWEKLQVAQVSGLGKTLPVR